MVRVTEDQARLLFGKQPAALKPRQQKPRAELPENQVEAQITGWLRAKGWIVERQQSGLWKQGERFIRIGAVGRCDWCAIKCAATPLVRYFEFELKAPGRKPSAEQLAYMRGRRAAGLVAEWFDSFDVFRAWFERTIGA